MPGTPITESDAFATTVTAPLPGEPASASSLLSEFLQPTANRCRYLFNRVVVFVSGGTLSPSDNVSIQTPTTKHLTLNSVTLNSVADGGGLAVGGPISNNNNADFGGACTAVSYSCTGAMHSGGAFTAATTIAATGTITGQGITSTASMSAAGTVQGDLISGVGSGGIAANFANVVMFSGAGRLLKRAISVVGAAGLTASVLLASKYYFPSAAAGSTIQIVDTGAQNGDELVFYNASTSNGVVIKDPSGTGLFTILNSGGSAKRAEFTRIAGTWTLTSAEPA